MTAAFQEAGHRGIVDTITELRALITFDIVPGLDDVDESGTMSEREAAQAVLEKGCHKIRKACLSAMRHLADLETYAEYVKPEAGKESPHGA